MGGASMHQPAQHQNTKRIYEAVKESEAGVKGGSMRGCAMAALHFDFEKALELCSVCDGHKKKFNEDRTNIEHLMNLLKQFKNLNQPPTTETAKQTEADTFKNIKYIVALNERVHNFVKNPYLKLFFFIMIESRGPRPIAEIFKDFNLKHVINLFDYVTLACRFLNVQDLAMVLKDKIDKGIAEGNLEVLALIGLKSERAVQLLQNFVDRTSDLQTAAYVASFAAAAAYQGEQAEVDTTKKQEMTKASNKRLAPYKRFIQTYRDMLNQLQLWNVRADFDVARGMLEKNENLRIFANPAQSMQKSKGFIHNSE